MTSFLTLLGIEQISRSNEKETGAHSFAARDSPAASKRMGEWDAEE
jgi:hypothetical protein